MKKQSAGQSILEVLFATTVVALVLAAILSTIIASLRNARTASEQSQSTSYAQETLEWLRRERDAYGWITFSESTVNVGETQAYCLGTLPTTILDISSQQGNCTGQTISDTNYVRELSLYRPTSEEIEATVTVIRPSQAGQTATTLRGWFTQWQ